MCAGGSALGGSVRTRACALIICGGSGGLHMQRRNCMLGAVDVGCELKGIPLGGGYVPVLTPLELVEGALAHLETVWDCACWRGS